MTTESTFFPGTKPPDEDRIFAVWNEIRPHLKFVQKPGRYIGGEWNQIIKDEASVTTRICLAFPDLYEIGMSHLGYKILYAILNRMEGVWAERAFAPWTDLETRLKKAGLPLVALESKRPLHQFDLVGFSLQFEMTYTGVLQMMDLGGIPVRSADRDERHPIVLGGGPAAVNPEPAWPFFDLILIGDGEEAFPELVARHRELKREGVKREEMIRQLAQLPGWYAPALYSVARDPISQLLCLQPSAGMPFPIKRRILMNLSDYPFPTDPVVPHLEIVHDRFSYEIMRGCNAGCRFCQAGYIYRPQRDRDPDEVQRGIKAGLQSTGYDEVTLASLNSGEYGSIDHLLEAGAQNWGMEGFAATALPSLRVPSVSTLMAKVLKRGRQKGFTLAPEGGSQRIRNVINKNVSDADIKRAAEIIFGEGWDLVKFYFIIGLPTETMEDVQGIVDRCNDVLAVARQKGRHRARINLSTSEFVPKPFTPFQWLPMEPRESVMDKIHHIKRRVPRGVDYKYHDLDQSIVECAISRGDRSLAPVIERAWRNGCEFDGWHDRFSMKTWLKSFEEEGVDITPFVYKEYPLDGGLPWDFINMDVRKSYFRQELAKAFQASSSAACGPDPCYGCGSFAKDCVSGELKTDTKPIGIEVPSRKDPRDGSGGEPPSFRYRITFGKSGDLALFGHLDLIRTLVLIMGRSRLPIKYSQGFHPIPEMNFGPALPLGVSGANELMDLYLNEPVEAERVLAALQRVTLPQLPIHSVQAVDRKAVKIQEATAWSEYRIEISDAQWREYLRPALPLFLAMTEFKAEIKRGEEMKLKDIRPMVVSAEWIEASAQSQTFIHAILKSGNDGGLKAEDFVSALAIIPGLGELHATAPLNERIIATRLRLLTSNLKEIPAPPPTEPVLVMIEKESKNTTSA